MHDRLIIADRRDFTDIIHPVPTGTAGDLQDLRVVQRAYLRPVEFPQFGKNDAPDRQGDSHADGIRRHDHIALAGGVFINLRPAGFRRKAAVDHGRFHAPLLQRTGDPEDAAAGKGDDRVRRTDFGQGLQRADRHQRREPLMPDDLIIRTDRAEHVQDQFLAFLCRKEVAIKNSEYAGAVSPVKAAYDQLYEDYTTDEEMFEGTQAGWKEMFIETMFPSAETLNRCGVMKDFEPSVYENVSRMWARLQ